MIEIQVFGSYIGVIHVLISLTIHSDVLKAQSFTFKELFQNSFTMSNSMVYNSWGPFPTSVIILIEIKLSTNMIFLFLPSKILLAHLTFQSFQRVALFSSRIFWLLELLRMIIFTILSFFFTIIFDGTLIVLSKSVLPISLLKCGLN